MPRNARKQLQRGCFHVLNRGNQRQTLFHDEQDYALFLDLLTQGQARHNVGLWGYCLMGNHWHLVVEVARIDDLSKWLHWICTRQARLFHLARPELGGGHLYQGRYKSFPIEDEIHLFDVLRYVEANPVRARLVSNARNWLWSSLSVEEVNRGLVPVVRPQLCPWNRDAEWEAAVNRPLEGEPLKEIQQSLGKGAPFGSLAWRQKIASEQGLQSTIRPPGRPRKSNIPS